MAPKKRKSNTQARARCERVISRDVLTPTMPAFVKQNLDTCGACLLPVESDAQLGLVDSCTHCFHFECVERWSKTENSCPQCKLRFFWLASYTPEGRRSSLQRVERRDQEGEEDDEFEDIQVCEKCKQVGEEANLLLCDGMNGTCNAAFHTTCVGLNAVPRGSWFCPDCVERGFDTDAHGKRGKRPREPLMESQESKTLTCEQQQRQQQQQRPTMQRPEAPGNALDSTAAVCATSVAIGANDSSGGSRSSSSAAASGSGGGGVRISSARGSMVVPSQLRLNALACVTPPVEVPTFQLATESGGGTNDGTRGNANAGGGRNQGGLFASFVQRRRQQQQSKAGGGTSTTDSSAGFIKLTPQYEQDFMGGAISK